LVQPGESVTCHLSPQRAHRGPYLLGIAQPANFVVESLQFGISEALGCPGAVPAERLSFEAGEPLPDRLVPIDAPALPLGVLVKLRVRNIDTASRVVSAVLWALPIPAAVLSSPDLGWDSEAEQARELDRMATVEHLVERARSNEPGDAWETPTDES
jgi:hypothetical protein